MGAARSISPSTGRRGPGGTTSSTCAARGPGDRCNRDAADAWSAEAKTRKRGRIDPCGSTVISHLRWDTSGGTGDRELGLFRDFTVDFTMEVKRFATQFRPGVHGVRAQVKVHLIGICGTGMGSLAGLLKAAGHDVRGSDEHVYPPMSTQLAEHGIAVFEGFGPANLDWAPEAVVVGNVCRKDHVEVLAAQERKIPLESFPSLFGKLFLRRQALALGRRGDPRQDDDLLVAGARARGRRARPVVPDRRRAAELPAVLAPRRGRRVRRRGRRVRHGVLRQGIEVPALPPAHRAPHLGRVRPRRHLPRRGGGAAPRSGSSWRSSPRTACWSPARPRRGRWRWRAPPAAR